MAWKFQFLTVQDWKGTIPDSVFYDMVMDHGDHIFAFYGTWDGIFISFIYVDTGGTFSRLRCQRDAGHLSTSLRIESILPQNLQAVLTLVLSLPILGIGAPSHRSNTSLTLFGSLQ